MILRDNAPGYEYAWVNYTACGAALVLFLLGLAHPAGLHGFLQAYGPSIERVFGGAALPGGAPGWLSLLYAPFLSGHALVGLYALLMLWQFGDNVEYVCGRPRYVLFVYGAGLAGTLVGFLFAPDGASAFAGSHATAAGAAMAYVLCFPHARLTWLTYIEPYSWEHAAAGDWGLSIRNMRVGWYLGGTWLLCLLFTLFIAATHAEVATACAQFFIGTTVGSLAGAGLVHLLEVPGRRAPRDETPDFEDLTSVWVGDEGDAGEGAVRGAPTLGAELSRLRSSRVGRQHRAALAAIETFEDPYATQLIAAGELKQAERHCLDMLDLAQRAQDDRRIRGYRRLLEKLATLEGQALAKRRARRDKHNGTDDPEVERWEEAIADVRSGGAENDAFGLGKVKRGTRRSGKR
jgi:membrane associated rhomboid family serine protease